MRWPYQTDEVVDVPDYDFTYHSGSGDTFVGSKRPGDVAPDLSPAFVAAPQALRKIRFETSQYGPNHVVTIRSSSTGWTSDTFGTYRNGAWEFFFEIPSLPPTLAFKFMLDGEHWMLGPDLSVTTSVDHTFDESRVPFPAAKDRFRHGYDNFQLDRSPAIADLTPPPLPTTS